MKFIFAVLCFFSMANLWAGDKGYELKMEISLNGKAPFLTQINVKEGVKGFAKTNGTLVEVIPSEGMVQGKSGILLKFTISSVDTNGKQIVFSRPEMLVFENKAAHISVSSEKNIKEELSLSVMAKKISL